MFYGQPNGLPIHQYAFSDASCSLLRLELILRRTTDTSRKDWGQSAFFSKQMYQSTWFIWTPQIIFSFKGPISWPIQFFSAKITSIIFRFERGIRYSGPLSYTVESSVERNGSDWARFCPIKMISIRGGTDNLIIMWRRYIYDFLIYAPLTKWINHHDLWWHKYDVVENEQPIFDKGA